MGDFSRDSFTETQNALGVLRGVDAAPLQDSKHYVSVRLQQRVPLLDADWNELDDIRRFEVETLLAQAIGNGAPAQSNGFRSREASQAENNLFIEPGLILVDGWMVYNPVGVDYVDQPHFGAEGLAPELPNPLPDAPVARLEMVFLDAWEREVDSVLDDSLVDPLVGLETAVRIERVWVVRMEPIAQNADPADPETIPNRQAGHRYYPLALVDRQPGAPIVDAHLTDIRRTHLTLSELTHSPLLIDDAAREQRLDAERLAAAFGGNLAAVDDVFRETPDAFVFAAEIEATWSLMTIYQDLRALAVALQEQALRDLLPIPDAMDAMSRFFDVQSRFRDELDRLILPPPDGISAGESAENFLAAYSIHLVDEPDSLAVAVGEEDLLGAVLAQERINHEIAELAGSRLDGTVSLGLIAVTPNGPVAAGVTYQLTVRITSLLLSAVEEEAVRVLADAGLGWNLVFQGSEEEDPSEILVVVPNQGTQDVVLEITAQLGTAPSALELRAFPERRQQRLFRHQDVALAIGSNILPEEPIIATLGYQGPPLAPGNVAAVSRSAMFNSGVPLPFRIENLSTEEEEFLLTITPNPPATDWDATPTELPIAPLAAGAFTDVNVDFQTSDEAGADSPQPFTLQLTQVVSGGGDVPLPTTAFSLTFQLT